MRNLPRQAQLFVLFIYAAALAAIACVCLTPLPHATTHWWELGLFALVIALLGHKRVPLTRKDADDLSGSMSLGFAITFAALLRFGPAWGLAIGCFGSLFSCLFRQPLYQVLFNFSLTALQGLLAGITFVSLNNWSLQLHPMPTTAAVAGSTLVYFLVNTGGVAIILGLCSNQKIFQVWRTNFLATAWTYFVGAGLATCAMLGKNAVIVLVILVVIVYVLLKSYEANKDREAEKQRYIDQLEEKKNELADLYLATIKSLALAIDAKDQYTHQHILRVQRYAVATARRMGLNEIDLEGVNTGALLHDIGKLGVPEYVLLKPGRLTDEEFEKIKQHPVIGAAILDPVEFPWPVLPVVKYHHERWDGSGYPEGLKGENIPLTARVLAVGDVYDALTSNRSYRHAWSHQRAVEYIRQGVGKHFDPVVVDAFLEVIDGVIHEMAAEGLGPLAPPAAPARTYLSSKAEEAAQHIQRTSTELFALYEVAQTLSSILGLDETLDILARKLEAIFPGSACLFLLKESESVLVAHAAVGLNREFFNGCQTLDASSLSLRVAADKQTFVGPYDPEDLMLNGVPLTLWTSLSSAIIVPITHKGDMLGTLNLYHTQPGAFQPHDQQLLETIAERAGMAVANGLLFERTRSHAITDPLTGLYNTRYLKEYMEKKTGAARARREVIEREQRALLPPDADGNVPPIPPERLVRASDIFAILCLDVESFKPINDNFGHPRGDEVLCDLARILRSTVREDDIVARYGGDEFVILMGGIGAEEARRMAERIQAAVERYDVGLHHETLGDLRLGISIGFACFPQDGWDWDTLFSTADTRMYHNKTERKLRRLVGKNAEETHEKLPQPVPSRAIERSA